MQLLIQKHLTVKLGRLQHSEEWKEGGGELLFIFLKGGKGKYALGGNAWNLHPGDVMVLSPTAGGKLVSQNGDLVFWYFSICSEHLFPLFSPGEICLLQNVTETFKPSKVYGATSPLAQECHRLVDSAPPEGNVDHRSHALRIAAAVLSVEFLKARKQRPGFMRVEDHMMQVFEKLSATELVTLSVGELADKFSCSRRHLNRLFHQYFGVSVAALRMEMRLLKAVSLLRDPSAKVISVAEHCGFNHLGLFNTCFKRRFGSTPGQWRKADSQSGGKYGTKGEPRKCETNGFHPASGGGEPTNTVQAKVYEIMKKLHPGITPNSKAHPPLNESRSRIHSTKAFTDGEGIQVRAVA